jgi:hypothetical protein
LSHRGIAVCGPVHPASVPSPPGKRRSACWERRAIPVECRVHALAKCRFTLDCVVSIALQYHAFLGLPCPFREMPRLFGGHESVTVCGEKEHGPRSNPLDDPFWREAHGVINILKRNCTDCGRMRRLCWPEGGSIPLWTWPDESGSSAGSVLLRYLAYQQHEKMA